MELNQAVQKTMLIPLWGRAQASRLYPQILVDQQAIDIVAAMDYDFTYIASSFDGFGAMSHLVRANAMDNAIRAYSAEHPRALVVNIGCGLDTNFSRTDNGTLRWYDLDLPGALAFRNSILAPLSRTHQLACSVFDTAWFDQVDFRGEDGAVFTASGVLYFFEEEAIRALFIRMAEAFPGGELVFDANSSTALERSKQMMRHTGNAGAEMFFAVDDPGLFEHWSPKIRLLKAAPRFCDTPRLAQMDESMKANMDACDAQNMIIQVHLQFL